MSNDCSIRLNAYNVLLSGVFMLIFLLSLLGNTIVIVTIAKCHQRRRSSTNYFLFNLALADLLRIIVCIPSTLLSEITQCWLLGRMMCKLVAFLQPVGVCASSYTLAVIAVERYYAICKPLQSRKWHTKKRALITITCVWILSFCANLGSLVIFDAVPNRENWTCDTTQGVTVDFLYQLYLTFVLLFIPLSLMVALYGNVIFTLSSNASHENPLIEEAFLDNVEKVRGSLSDWLLNGLSRMPSIKRREKIHESRTSTSDGWRLGALPSATMLVTPRASFDCSTMLRSTNQEKINEAKKRVIHMLMIIVAIFSACWVPSFLWWLLIRTADLMGVNLWHYGINSTLTLLTYVSSMTNPLTYCFMNKSFRTSLFGYCRTKRSRTKHTPMRCATPLSLRTPSDMMCRAAPFPVPTIKVDYAVDSALISDAAAVDADESESNS